MRVNPELYARFLFRLAFENYKYIFVIISFQGHFVFHAFSSIRLRIMYPDWESIRTNSFIQASLSLP